MKLQRADLPLPVATCKELMPHKQCVNTHNSCIRPLPDVFVAMVPFLGRKEMFQTAEAGRSVVEVKLA